MQDRPSEQDASASADDRARLREMRLRRLEAAAAAAAAAAPAAAPAPPAGACASASASSPARGGAEPPPSRLAAAADPTLPPPKRAAPASAGATPRGGACAREAAELLRLLLGAPAASGAQEDVLARAARGARADASADASAAAELHAALACVRERIAAAAAAAASGAASQPPPPQPAAAVVRCLAWAAALEAQGRFRYDARLAAASASPGGGGPAAPPPPAATSAAAVRHALAAEARQGIGAAAARALGVGAGVGTGGAAHPAVIAALGEAMGAARVPAWLWPAIHAGAHPDPSPLPRTLGPILAALLRPLRSMAADDPAPFLGAPLADVLGAPGAGEAVGRVLEDELVRLRSRAWGGRALQERSALAPPFTLGCPEHTFAERLAGAKPHEVEGVVRAMHAGLGTAHGAGAELLKRACKAGPAPREHALGWLARALCASAARAEHIRTSAQSSEHALAHARANAECGGDEFVCGLAASALRLCRPFLAYDGPAPPAATLARLHLRYYASTPRADRPAYGRGARLAGALRVGGAEGEGGEGGLYDEEGDAPMPPPAAQPAGPHNAAAAGQPQPSLFHFVGEIFFLAQYGLRVGLVPAVRRCSYELLRLERTLAARKKGADADADADGAAAEQAYRLHQAHLVLLAQPDLVQDSLDFVRLQAAWLATMAALPAAEAEAAFAAVPAWVVLDMAAWLCFVAEVRPRELALQPLRHLMASLSALIRAGCPQLDGGRRLIRSPVILGKLVEVVHAVVVPAEARAARAAGGWGGGAVGSPLADALLAERPTCCLLIEPLVATYAAVDAVEGLDVDSVEAADFEKFAVRGRINALLLALWRLPEPRATLVQLGSAARTAPALSALLHGCVDTVLYSLDEALRRLRELNRAAAGGAPAEEAEGGGGARYVRHLLRTADSTLELAATLAAEPALGALLAVPPVSARLAAMLVQFVPCLAGPRAVALRLWPPAPAAAAAEGAAEGSEPADGGAGGWAGAQRALGAAYKPRALLSRLLCLLARTAPHGGGGGGVAAQLGACEDLELGAFESAMAAVERDGLLPAEERQALAAAMAEVRAAVARGGGGAAGSSGGGGGGGAAGGAAAGAAAGGGGSGGGGAEAEEALFAELRAELGPIPPPSATAIGGGSGLRGAAGGGLGASARLVSAYAAALGPLAYDAAALLEAGCVPAHSFRAQALEGASGDSAPAALRKTLMAEVRRLQRGDLPLHPDAAIFVRQDEGHMGVWRALMTGPMDTPYALGCFVFDLLCLPEYPAIPPLMRFITTAGGTVKFNPNLYADGKVCASLLGTFSGADASQRWDPARSSLYQLLVSVQSQMLVEAPFLNEPGYEDRPPDCAESAEYNSALRLHTVRHAMVAMLRSPPCGFEDVVRAHFARQRARVLRLVWRWAADAPPELRPRMVAALAQLRAALPPAEAGEEEAEAEEAAAAAAAEEQQQAAQQAAPPHAAPPHAAPQPPPPLTAQALAAALAAAGALAPAPPPQPPPQPPQQPPPPPQPQPQQPAGGIGAMAADELRAQLAAALAAAGASAAPQPMEVEPLPPGAALPGLPGLPGGAQQPVAAADAQMAAAGEGPDGPDPPLSSDELAELGLGPADAQALQRLEGLGFGPSVALEAYLVCERNETLAANFLFSQYD